MIYIVANVHQHYTHDENYPTIGKTYDSIDLEAYGKGIHLLIENKEIMIWGEHLVNNLSWNRK